MAGLSRTQYLDADGKSKVKYTFQRKLDHPRRSREMNQAEKGVEEPQVSGRFLPKKRLEKSDNIGLLAPGSDLMKMKSTPPLTTISMISHRRPAP